MKRIHINKGFFLLILTVLILMLLQVLCIGCGSGDSSEPESNSAPKTSTPTKSAHGETVWDVEWSTLTGSGEWGAPIGNMQFPATFNYDWSDGDLYGGYSDYVGFTATSQINVQRDASSFVSFHVGSDDAIRLYVDNNLVLDDWAKHDYRTKNATVSLAPGFHSLRIRYYEWTADAQVMFSCDYDVLDW